MAFTPPWNLIGQTVSGDFADLTIYTDKHGQKVFFPKAPPKEPPSIRQINQRARFRLAVKAYIAQPATVKANYEAATKKLALALTGQNLYVSVSLRGNLATLHTIRRQTGIDLVTPADFSL